MKPPSSPASAPEGRSSFIQDALRLLGNNVVVTGLSFVTGVILARALGAEGRGLIAAVMVYPSTLISLTELGVRQASAFYLGKRVFSDSQVVGALCTLILITGVGGAAICAGILVLSSHGTFTPLIVLLAVAVIPTTIAKNYSSGVFLGKRMVGQFTRIMWMAEVQRLIIVVVAVWWFRTGVPGALLAMFLSSVLIAVYALQRVAKIAPLVPSFEWPVVWSLLKMGMIYALALFVLQLNYKADVALMQHLSTVSEIGVYTVGVNVAQLIWAFPQSITPALFSHTANEADDQAFARKVARLFRVTLVIAFVGLIVLAVGAPIAIPIVYGAQFRASVLPLQLLLPGVFCVTGLRILNNNLSGQGRPIVSLSITTPALVVNVLLNLYLLPRYGARGAAVASSISYSLACAGMMILYCRVTNMTLLDLLRFQRSDFEFLRRLGPGLRARAKAKAAKAREAPAP